MLKMISQVEWNVDLLELLRLEHITWITYKAKAFLLSKINIYPAKYSPWHYISFVYKFQILLFVCAYAWTSNYCKISNLYVKSILLECRPSGSDSNIYIFFAGWLDLSDHFSCCWINCWEYFASFTFIPFVVDEKLKNNTLTFSHSWII